MSYGGEIEKMIDTIERNNTVDVIGICTLIVSILALFVSIIVNIITYKNYIERRSPFLSCQLFLLGHFIYLEVENTGESQAHSIIFSDFYLENNGDNDIFLDDVFKKEIFLFPKEKIQGRVAVLKNSISEEFTPQLTFKVEYVKGNTNKKESYLRTVSFRRTESQSPITCELYNIRKELSSIKYSENRIANYFEGETLFTYDEIERINNKSLKKDLLTVCRKMPHDNKRNVKKR